MSIKKNKDFFFTKLAFEQAKINLGCTGKNPSVGCVVEKNDSVISSGHTSLYGRPHAEVNALRKNVNFENATMYVSLEPCSHYGKTPPCTNLIIKKKILPATCWFSFTQSLASRMDSNCRGATGYPSRDFHLVALLVATNNVGLYLIFFWTLLPFSMPR